MVYWGIGHQDSSNDCIIHFDSWGSEVHSFRTAKHAGFSQKRASKTSQNGIYITNNMRNMFPPVYSNLRNFFRCCQARKAVVSERSPGKRPDQLPDLWPFQSYFWRTLLLDPDNVEFLDSKTSKESIQAMAAMVCLPFDQEMSRKKRKNIVQ